MSGIPAELRARIAPVLAREIARLRALDAEAATETREPTPTSDQAEAS